MEKIQNSLHPALNACFYSSYFIPALLFMMADETPPVCFPFIDLSKNTADSLYFRFWQESLSWPSRVLTRIIIIVIIVSPVVLFHLFMINNNNNNNNILLSKKIIVDCCSPSFKEANYPGEMVMKVSDASYGLIENTGEVLQYNSALWLSHNSPLLWILTTRKNTLP